MTSTEAARKATIKELTSMLGRLQTLDGETAEHYRRDAWACIADLELGCRCEEAAHTLVLSAEHWLEDTAA